jgi:hypothetical protein
MKKQICILAIVAVTALISFASGSAAAPNTFDANGDLCLIGENNNTSQAIGDPMELWMGVGNELVGTLVGKVTFDNNNVIINLTDVDLDGIPDIYPFIATKVHIHFDVDYESIPQNRPGNPQVGLFEYSADELDLLEYIVEIDNPYSSEIVIPVVFDDVGSIHLHVERDYSDVVQFGEDLPDDLVDMKITYPQPDSYLELTLENAGILNGMYDAWCVDVDQSIDNNTWYEALLYSSYEDLSGLEFEHPENFDKVNYLLNNFYAGKLVEPLSAICAPAASCGAVKPPESLTKGDIQRAIWTLIDDNLTTMGLGPWSQDRVNAILCDVNANGEGFIPDCDDDTVFISVPVDGDTQLIAAQTVIGTLGIECVTAEETAWGDGKDGMSFDGSQWGTYFNYDDMCLAD